MEQALELKIATMWYSLPALCGLPAWRTIMADERELYTQDLDLDGAADKCERGAVFRKGYSACLQAQ